MKKLYLDYNIILEMKKNEEFKRKILKYKKYFRFFYSPAHVEEIFKAKKTEYKEEIPELLNLLNEMSDTWELLPPPGEWLGGYVTKREKIGIIETQENSEKCYKRIEDWDTRNIIEDLSKTYLNHKDVEKIEEISNFLPERVFKNTEVKQKLKKFSEKEGVSVYKCEKKYDKIKFDYNKLELVIELLFHFLNEIGYSTNRTEIQALSGIHDNTHCCYATKCDLFITTDNRLSKKSKAIYSFLGIKTKVHHIHYKKIDEIFKILDAEK